MFAVAFEGKSAKITKHLKHYKKILKNAYFYGKVVLSLSEVEKKRHVSVEREIMYFTNRTKKELLLRVKKDDYDVYAIKLRTGVFENDEIELSQVVDAMFRAWRKMVMYKSKNYMRAYDGFIRRLFFEYQEDTDLFSPIFYLIGIRKKTNFIETDSYKILLEKEKLRMQTYIKWFSSWSLTLKVCTQVSVDFSLVELENLESLLTEFCTNEKYTLFPLIDEAKKVLLKKASGDGKHKLVSFHGIFKNRHVSVER